MAHREYGPDAMKRLQAEARARRKAELEEKREAQRLKELEEYEAQKEIRHRAWAAKGNHFFERKIAEEKAMEEAAEFRRLEAIRIKKEQEEQKKRLAEAYAARMEAARLVAEAKEREIKGYMNQIEEKQKEIEKQGKLMLKIKDERMDYEAKVDDTF